MAKNLLLALWIIQKYIFVIFEWSFMTWQGCQMMENILILSQYAILSRSNKPISRKWSKTSFFGSLDHSKLHFFDFWMILHDLVMLQNGRKRSVLSQYAISSWSDQPIWRKWPILNWIIQKYIFVIFEWHGCQDFSK